MRLTAIGCIGRNREVWGRVVSGRKADKNAGSVSALRLYSVCGGWRWVVVVQRAVDQPASLPFPEARHQAFTGAYRVR